MADGAYMMAWDSSSSTFVKVLGTSGILNVRLSDGTSPISTLPVS